MTKYNKNQAAEYVVREVARRIVPEALEATWDDDCIQQSKVMRGLADDASMTDVHLACKDAAACAAAYDAPAAAAIAAAADGAGTAVVAVRATVHATHASGRGAVARQEYAAILAEAAVLAEAS